MRSVFLYIPVSRLSLIRSCSLLVFIFSLTFFFFPSFSLLSRSFPFLINPLPHFPSFFANNPPTLPNFPSTLIAFAHFLMDIQGSIAICIKLSIDLLVCSRGKGYPIIYAFLPIQITLLD